MKKTKFDEQEYQKLLLFKARWIIQTQMDR